MADRIQLRRDIKSEWEIENPILLEGELGIVLDEPNLYKVGNGVQDWNSLPYRGFTGTVSQIKGDSEYAVMSQKIVSEELNKIENANKEHIKSLTEINVSNICPNLGYDDNDLIGGDLYDLETAIKTYEEWLLKEVGECVIKVGTVLKFKDKNKNGMISSFVYNTNGEFKPSYTSMFIILTEDEYDELVVNNQIIEDMFYMIKEVEDEDK